MDLELKDRVALVANADCEVGAAVASALAREGLMLGIHGASAAGLQAALAELRERGAAVSAYAEISAAEALGKLAGDRGGCQIAVFVLPGLPEGSITAVGDDQTLYGAWAQVETAAELFQKALPLMQPGRWGRLLFVGPVEAKALTGRPADLDRAIGMGILGLQKALSGELGPSGLTCNSVLWDSASVGVDRERILRSTGAAVAFLASPKADFLTGLVVSADHARHGGVF